MWTIDCFCLRCRSTSIASILARVPAARPKTSSQLHNCSIVPVSRSKSPPSSSLPRNRHVLASHIIRISTRSVAGMGRCTCIAGTRMRRQDSLGDFQRGRMRPTSFAFVCCLSWRPQRYFRPHERGRHLRFHHQSQFPRENGPQRRPCLSRVALHGCRLGSQRQSVRSAFISVVTPTGIQRRRLIKIGLTCIFVLVAKDASAPIVASHAARVLHPS